MNPAVRASDEDRRRVVGALERHTTAGRLRLDEFDERAKAALTAVTLDDLAALTADLPRDAASGALAPSPSEVDGGARSLMIAFVVATVTLVALAAMLAVGR